MALVSGTILAVRPIWSSSKLSAQNVSNSARFVHKTTAVTQTTACAQGPTGRAPWAHQRDSTLNVRESTPTLGLQAWQSKRLAINNDCGRKHGPTAIGRRRRTTLAHWVTPRGPSLRSCGSYSWTQAGRREKSSGNNRAAGSCSDRQWVRSPGDCFIESRRRGCRRRHDITCAEETTSAHVD